MPPLPPVDTPLTDTLVGGLPVIDPAPVTRPGAGTPPLPPVDTPLTDTLVGGLPVIDPPPAEVTLPGAALAAVAAEAVTDTLAGPSAAVTDPPPIPATGTPLANTPLANTPLADRPAGKPLVGEPRRTAGPLEILVWLILAGGGLAALAAGGVPAGPDWLPAAGSVAIATAYTWLLAARSGGRPVVFSFLALVVGVCTLVLDNDELRTGAAVLLAVISAVLGVIITVPAVRFFAAVREACLAIIIAGIGALAVLGLEPRVDVARFEYVVLGLALVGAFGLVYRLGAGLHGLGTRGFVIAAFGSVVMIVTLLYAETLRRYGTPDVVTTMHEVVRWSREHLGAFPRPVQAVLGVPALVWGTHMRARRRQGWWVCAFGVAGTTAVSDALVNSALSVREYTLSVVYGLVAGLIIGFIIVRIDLALTRISGGDRAVGRTGRRAEEAEHAIRPEPKRTAPLL
jgi:hypothetical protein